MKVMSEEDLEKELMKELNQETLIKIKVEEPESQVVYSNNFHNNEKMFSIYGIEREIFNFE